MLPTDTPNVSACRSARMNERSSLTWVRSSSAWSESDRDDPARISPSMRLNSSASGPGTRVTTRASACSKPRPASTLMVRRSRMSGSLLRMAFWRSATIRLSEASGPSSPAMATRATTASRSRPFKDVNFHTTSPSTGMATMESTRSTRNLSTSSICPRPARTSLWRTFSMYQGGDHAAAEGLLERLLPTQDVRLVVGEAGLGGTDAEALVGRQTGGEDEQAGAQGDGDAGDGEDDGSEEEDLPRARMPQGRDVGRVHGVDEQPDGDRHDRDDDGADPAFGGERAHLPPQALALLHGAGHDVEQLGQVAADLALDGDGRHHPVEVLALDPLGQVVEGLDERASEAGLGHDLAHLLPRRLRQLARHGVEALQDREPRAQGGGEELQHVGELRGEGLGAAVGHRLQDDPGGHGEHGCTYDKSDDPAHQVADGRRRHYEDPVEEQRLGRPHHDGGPHQLVLQVLEDPPP